MSLNSTSNMRLEIDESIIHSQLKINVNIVNFNKFMKITDVKFLYFNQKEDEEFHQLLSAALSERDGKQSDANLPYKTVKPKPGKKESKIFWCQLNKLINHSFRFLCKD